MYSDKELISKILEGNQNAFTLLVKKHERLVYHLVYRIVLDNEATKDICQEVFVKVYLKLEGFKFDAKLSTWIATIAYRYALNYLKKRKSTPVDHIDTLANYEKTSSPLLPLEALERKDIQKHIQKSIESLPLQYKTVLTLYHLNEFNYKEIYAITGWPEGTVKSYLFRARNLLKVLLEKKFNKIDIEELNTKSDG